MTEKQQALILLVLPGTEESRSIEKTFLHAAAQGALTLHLAKTPEEAFEKAKQTPYALCFWGIRPSGAGSGPDWQESVRRELPHIPLVFLTGEEGKENRWTEQILSAMTSIVIAVRRDGIVTYWNPAAEKIFGVSRDRVMGRPLTECGIPWDLARMTDAVRECLENGRMVKAEDVAYTRKEHGAGLLGFSIKPLADEAGKIQEALLLGADITERRRATEALRCYTRDLEFAKVQIEREKAKDEAILAAVGDGLIVTDDTGRIILVNKQAAGMFGWLEEERVEGALLWERIPLRTERGKKIERNEHPVAEALRTGKKATLKTEAVLASGAHISLQITASPVLLEGKIAGAVGIFRDIGKEREIERAKSEFVSTVSHELRTPLTSIREGTAQVLEGILGPVNEDQQEFLGIVLEEVDRLAAIINDLLDISKIEAGKVVLKKTWVDFRDMAGQIAAEYRTLMKNKKIELAFSVPEEETDAFCDADKIRQVMTNLLTNAYKFTPEGGRVTIEVRDGAEEIRVSIRDTGIGISKEHIPKLFDKFVQVGRTAGPGIKGTGLGLAICKNLVEMHRGKIWAESETGRGSSFTFTLPKLQKDYAAKENIDHGLEDLVSEASPLSLILFKLRPLGNDEKKVVKGSCQKILKKFFKKVQQGVLSVTGDIFLNGSDESIVILPGADKRMAYAAAEKLKAELRLLLEESQKSADPPFGFETGISAYPEDAETSELLLSKARLSVTGPEGKEDRRRAARAIYAMDILLRAEDGEDLYMQTIDISAGGAQIYGICGLKVGNSYNVHMDLPKGFGHVTGKGIAVWVKHDKRRDQYWAGLQFVGMSDAMLRKITRFVQAEAGKADEDYPGSGRTLEKSA